MKQLNDIGKETKGQYLQRFDDSIIISYLTFMQLQPAGDQPFIFLVRSKGASPPDCKHSPGTGYNLSPDIQPVVTKWSNIKN
jgi:hypothetical protein